MCQWYCTSEGPLTNLHCLHCNVRYCGACLHGEAGKMESLVKCAGCGKKPRVKANATRRGWGAEVRSPQGTSKTVLRPPKRGLDAQAYWAYKHAQQAAEEDGSFSWDSAPSHRSIFDKLTDPSLYTGSHKHRFDEEGRGRGLEGRDSVSKGLGTGAVLNYYGDGPVISIAQLVRNEKLDPQHMNKLRKFPDGTTILSPHNRSWKCADSKWRPDIERGVYPQNNPTYQRQASPAPHQLAMSSRAGAAAAAGLSGSQSARSVGSSPLLLGSSHRSSGGGGLAPHPHDINLLTSQGRSRFGGDYAQEGQYAPQVVGPTPVRSPRYQSQSQSPPPTQRQSVQAHQQQQQAHYQRPQTASYIGSPIFDKLTDPAQYTGSHKHRFDEQGHGLGLAGRVEVAPDRYQGDSYASANINDLSQITRQNFNAGSPQSKGHKFQY